MPDALLPLYYQIKQILKKCITNGEFQAGEKLPSENELAAKFEVNRLTIRQAISQLIQEGFLTTKRGSGTFLTKDKKRINSLSIEMTGFMDEIFYQVQKAKTKFAEIENIDPSPYVINKLKLLNNAKVVRIKRVRFLGKETFNYAINYLPQEIGKRITKKELYKKPLLHILEQDFGIKFLEAFQTIEASFANPTVADKLGIALGSPMLFVDRVIYEKGNKPVSLLNIWYRGDLFKYVVRLKNIRRNDSNVWIHNPE